jgi:pimeloyl-ACP methyl ester carboxylesterase
MRKTISAILLTIFLSGTTAFVSIAQAGKVQVNGITIAYESYGTSNKETILLISGTNAQLTMWDPGLRNKLVQKGYRVIVFDNRDIGLSTKFDHAGMPDWAAITKALEEGKQPPLAYSLDDMAKDAVALLDALKIKKAHIVGASMGGMIAQRIAYDHPQYVLSLTSIMAGGGRANFPLVAKPEVVSKIPAPGPVDDTAAYIRRELQSMKLLSGSKFPSDEQKLISFIRANVKRSYHPDGLVRQGAASMAAFYAGRELKLQTIKVPAIVIHGSDDPLVAVDAARDVAAAIPGAEFHLLEGMGHNLPEPLHDTIARLFVKNASKVIRR